MIKQIKNVKTWCFDINLMINIERLNIPTERLNNPCLLVNHGFTSKHVTFALCKGLPNPY